MQSASHDQLAPLHTPAYRNRSVLSALIGIIGFFCVLGVSVSLAGDVHSLTPFLSVPSILIVIFAPLVVLIGVFGLAGVIDAWVWVFRRPTPGKTAEDASTFFQLAAGFALASGFLATVVGLILALKDLNDPRQAGFSMSVAMLSQLYGVFLAVVYLAIAAYVARRHNGVAGMAALAQRATSIAGLTTIAGVLTAMIAFGILMLSISPCL
ncbi:MAG TPA: MotA/TolQ/ExbB proton channel family protein [Phycisphaerae bacterium]|nr:MotA/TolQ/ExbB proton channel family protein [Phycisphaerae bacterium]